MSLADSSALVEPRSLSSGVNKKVLLAGVVGTVVVLDFVTKMWAMNTLTFGYPVPVLGEFFRLTYTHNPGAAFGINIGEHSRIFFLVLSLIALVVLGLIYGRRLRVTDFASWRLPSSAEERSATSSIVSGSRQVSWTSSTWGSEPTAGRSSTSPIQR